MLMASNPSLLARIKEAATAYYGGADPIMSDSEYDTLVTQAQDLGLEVPLAGGYKAKGRKVAHLNPMMSLDKVHNLTDLHTWLRKLPQGTEVSVEPKWDGLSVEIAFDGDRFIASTRGNGEIGEDVTAVVAKVPNFPRPTAKQKANGIIFYGEIMLPQANLEAAGTAAGRIFANTRNAAAGILRQEKKPELGRFLTFRDHNDESYGSQFDKSDLDGIDAATETILALARDESRELDMDGAVVKVLDDSTRKALGATNKHPRWAMAVKPQAVEATTILRDVEWATGRTGKIVGTAVFDPISLLGAVTRRATLHNPSYIAKLGLHFGDELLVRRAGDVIPKVESATRSDETTTEVKMPETCPNCGGKTNFNGVELRCESGVCNLADALTYAIGVLGVKGVGPALIAGILENRSDIFDIVSALDYLLTITAGDIVAIDRQGQQSADNAVEALSTMRNAKPWQWLAALGIPTVGRTQSKAIIATIPLSELGDVISRADLGNVTVLDGIDGIGEKRIDSLCENMERVDALINLLDKRGLGQVLGATPAPVVSESTDSPTSSKWSGKNVVITGTLSMPRAAAAAWFESQGANVQSSVSKTTDYLICGDNVGATKTNKAAALGVTVLDASTIEIG